MDESALRRALASLDDCSSLQHWWLGFWTTVVVVGVAFEIIFVVWEYIEERRDCRRSLLSPPVTPNLPLFILGFLGAAMVTAGVAGELFEESKIATVETCIRKGNDQLSLLLSKEAGDAKTSALIALKAALVVSEAAQPRKLDAEQLAESLRKFARTPVAFFSMGDTEPSLFREMLVKALTQPNRSGWKDEGGGSSTGGAMWTEIAIPGICIEVSGMWPEENGANGVIKHSAQERAGRLAELSKPAKALKSALNAQGIAAKLCSTPPNRGMGNRIEVFIGPKPLPEIPEELKRLVASH